MTKQRPRKRFRQVSKYEKILLLPVILSNSVFTVAIIVIMAFLMLRATPQGTGLWLSISPSELRIGSFVVCSIVLGCNLLFFRWSSRANHGLAGPLERVIRELDETLNGKRERKPIKIRESDSLYELVEKINKLLR